MKILSLIAAVADNLVVGSEGRMPWYIPNDLKQFKITTLYKPVIMGRKTHESIGRALPERLNIVLSRDEDYRPAKDCFRAKSLDEALFSVTQYNEVFVIGGAQLYCQVLPICDRIYLTRVHLEPEGDAFFPPIDWSHFTVESTANYEADVEENRPAWSFHILNRRATYRDRLYP